MLIVSPGPRIAILGMSAVAVSHTGNTNETTLATVVVPARTMGLNGRLRITALWSATNNANAKTTRIKFGATTFNATSVASNSSNQQQIEISNRNAANSQVCRNATIYGAWGGTTAAIVTGAIDTTADVNLVFSGQLGVGTDTISLESYLVELIV